MYGKLAMLISFLENKKLSFFKKLANSENIKLFAIGSAVFVINQLVEYILIKFLNVNHSDLCKWDCNWYSGIVNNGYDIEPHAHPKMDAANWAFFPFFPLTAKIFAFLTNVSASISLILTSKAFFFLSILSFMKMSKEYSPGIPYFLSGSVVAFSPYAIYGNVGYSESSFLFFSSLFFYYIKKQKIIVASIVGSILTAVRFVGVFSILSYLSCALFRLRQGEDFRVLFLGVLLIPLGLAVFMFYLYWLTGDALAFMHIQRAWNRIPSNPFVIIFNGFYGNLLDKYWAILSLAAILSAVYLSYRRMHELAVFSFFCTVIPLSTGLWAMPRYIFWQAPILFLIAYFSSRNSIWFLLLPIFTVGQAIMYIGWFSDKGWVL